MEMVFKKMELEVGLERLGVPGLTPPPLRLRKNLAPRGIFILM